MKNRMAMYEFYIKNLILKCMFYNMVFGVVFLNMALVSFQYSGDFLKK